MSPIEQQLRMRAATVNAQTIDEEHRSIEVVMATEDPVLSFEPRSGDQVLEVLLMSGFTQESQVVLFDSHPQLDELHFMRKVESTDVRGSARDIRVEDNQLIGRMFFASDARSLELWSKYRDGHMTDVSTGHLAMRGVSIEPGQTAEVEGRTFTAPRDKKLIITTSWMARELSCVPWGADVRAKVRSQLQADHRRARHRAHLIMLGMNPSATDEQADHFFAESKGAMR